MINLELYSFTIYLSLIKLGIITNGKEYKFFTDLTTNNIMDEKLFLVIDLTNLKDSGIDNLLKFKKDTFNTESLVKYAEELVYTSALDATIKDFSKNSNDEFIRFSVKYFSNSRVTTNVIDRFRPLVKKAISNAVLDIVSKGLYQQDNSNSIIETPTESLSETETLKENPNEEDTIKKKSVITTDNELKAFKIIKNILVKNRKQIDGLNYKDTTNYFSLYVNSINKWFLRIDLDANNKYIMTKLSVDNLKILTAEFNIDAAPKGIAESRIYINSIDDLKKLQEIILKCYEEIS